MRISTIVIVEDEPDIRNSLIEILRDEGYRVVGFASGQEALSFLAQAATDLVLLDWYLADMNGSDFLRRLKADVQKEIPVLVTSAGMPDERENSLPIGCKIITKPYNLRKLLAEIALAVASPGPV